MGNPYFRFKQFTVWHDRCAMKVGTDGVLLGAWAGQGCPEMLAQRFPAAQVTGIDPDAAAAAQAAENFSASPWPQRLHSIHISLQEFCRGTTIAGTAGGPIPRFDLIVSNPPFYDTSLTNPNPLRTTARHTGSLTHEELLLLSAGLLTPQGVFSLIVPSESEKSILRLAERSRLHLLRLTRVYTRASSGPRRILASFGRYQIPHPVEDTLMLTDAEGARSPEHKALTQDFYLT